MSNIPPFFDEGIIEVDGPGFVGDFQDEKGDFAAPLMSQRTACPPHPGAILRDLYLPRTGVTLTELAAHRRFAPQREHDRQRNAARQRRYGASIGAGFWHQFTLLAQFAARCGRLESASRE